MDVDDDVDVDDDDDIVDIDNIDFDIPVTNIVEVQKFNVGLSILLWRIIFCHSFQHGSSGIHPFLHPC